MGQQHVHQPQECNSESEADQGFGRGRQLHFDEGQDGMIAHVLRFFPEFAKAKALDSRR